MAEIGAFGYIPLGLGSKINYVQGIINSNGANTRIMNTINNGTCFRFIATTTKDIKSVKINWYAVGSPPNVTLTIEGIDSDGKPDGTPYDASATKTFTPTVGWQTVTFDTLPTTGLTVGNVYGIVMISQSTSGTLTLRSFAYVGAYPICEMEAADGTTRSNFAETDYTTPVCTLVFDDDTEEACGMCPYATTTSMFTIYGADRWVGAVFTIPSGIQMKVRGVALGYLLGYGTAGNRGDVRVRILNSSNGEEASQTVDRDCLKDTGMRELIIPFDVATLGAGTHRIVIDSAGSNATDYWGFRGATASSTKFVPTFCRYTYCTDASTGPTWTDDSYSATAALFLLDDISATGGGGGETFTGTLINRGIN